MITTNNKISEWSALVDPLLSMLIEECKTDNYLAKAMRKADKSMEACAETIYNEVKKSRSGQKCVCISDKEVVQLAKNYFLS